MDIQTIAALLGKRSTDPDVESVLRACGVMRRPQVQVTMDDGDGPVVKPQDWVSNLSSGIEFGFWEEASLLHPEESSDVEGPMILTEIYFHGARPGTLPYPSLLPFGLLLHDSRDDVRAKMAARELPRRSYLRDTWDHPSFRITVSYADGGARIDFVLCMQPSTAAIPGRADMPPRVDVMVGLLGRRVDDPAIPQAFGVLGQLIARRTSRPDMEPIIDLERKHGIKLIFKKPAADVPTLHMIECVRPGESGSAGWCGELPFSINFDDSPETIFAKVGKPTNVQDQDFVGRAFWERADHSLQVVYSTMENIVLRVCLFASDA